MSDASKCDRCGTLFAWRKGNVSYGFSIAQAKQGNRVEWGTEDGQDFDLCPNCSRSFLNFHEPIKGTPTR